MKKTSKFSKIVSVVLCMLILASTMSMFASAAISNPGTADPMFNTIGTCSCALYISGVNSSSVATLQTAVYTNLSIKMELQKLKSGTYTTIETWTKTGSGVSMIFEKDRLINILSTYRLRVTFTAGNESHVMYAYP